MATHHEGSGQPFDRDTDMTREEQQIVDTDVDFSRTSILRTQLLLKMLSVPILLD